MLQQIESLGKTYHDRTKHSYLSVSIDPNYVDSSTQPSVYKRYPRFYRRFPLEPDNPVHSFIRHTSAISFRKSYRDGDYFLRVNPSAGALYPTEIYIQIRGIKGMIDGIYHLEIETECLTLIYELIDDGIDSYLFENTLINGLTFLIGCAYFRSSWKYKNRSVRYCFLDSGHHLGAIEASAIAHQRDIQILFDFDKIGLNTDLGLENKEFITACVIAGEGKEKSVRRLREKIPFVSATDYFEPNSFVEMGYRETTTNQTIPYKRIRSISPYTDLNLETILNRRSARCFRKGSISLADYQEIYRVLTASIPTESEESIEIYSVIHRVDGLEMGLYRGEKLLQAGDFGERAKYLCVNQAIARDSAVTFFFASRYENYQTAVQIAGYIGQRLYLASRVLAIDCSGIGAYFDDETAEFLGTDRDILYAMAIGR
ncbi:nitroreductase family protein [Pannus brasiliensis CCIBt3594]|uniref:Nitroreductase family protein n=1 Tax=Pannus brasiliensis CCIBt3594 TaxID=1427578 RepID=A0AAW9QGV4_9CHRO